MYEDDTAFKDYHNVLFQTHLVRQIKEEKDPLKYDLILYKRIFLNTSINFSFKANASYFFFHISTNYTA